MATLNPYIHFDGTARDAMEFYKSIFGGTLTLNTYKESNMSHGPSDDDKIMHSQLTGDSGIMFMGSDAPSDMSIDTGARISMSLSGTEEGELKGYWEKLSDGANIEQPLEKAPWGDSFGMLTDKFGVRWMVNITAPKN